jgi:leader peptidase (prepilin peptidase)/N-methyltransferase
MRFDVAKMSRPPVNWTYPKERKIKMGNLTIATIVMFVPLAYSLAVAIPLAVIDLRERRLPNKLVLPNLAISLLAVLFAIGLGEWQRGLVALGISVLVFGVGLFISIKGWLGMGDVKLLTALSLSLSWFSVWNIPIVLGVSVAVVAVAIAIRYFTKRIHFGSTIAMGPYILAVSSVLSGNILLGAF